MFKALVLGASAFALTAAPVAASAAAPASKLSLANAPRAAKASGRAEGLTGAGIGPIAAIAILAGIVVGGYFIIDEHEDDSDSN